MKKSTILTFATAVAIVATSAGTFAAWDQLEDTSDVANLVVGTCLLYTSFNVKASVPLFAFLSYRTFCHR